MAVGWLMEEGVGDCGGNTQRQKHEEYDGDSGDSVGIVRSGESIARVELYGELEQKSQFLGACAY